ncbi:MAG TPA: bifunctional 5,10-methylenetetrahydrofolate dehydrogenase/5,10-methenyltetrahydrofolate cyclohydrolase [Candidatus Saccharimonadales bacterium]|nr:bifunctional 5,10-methylenetetrahydrofolate dehydrogenase/5,10-methenyltetrahydrofolate cyclohydrolase [Candidatus Saccharimonadales bacterium]
MRILDGLDLASFVKERQLHQVRGLRQAHNIIPKLAIIRTSEDSRIAAYVRLKKAYGDDISVEVEEHFVPQTEALDLIKRLNADDSVTGMIVQLPLADPAHTSELLNAVAPEKDVDGLGENAILDPATPLAILWLLAGYNVEVKGKNIVVIGQGRLVGAPLTKMLRASGCTVTTVTRETDDLVAAVRSGDIIISAAGSPGLLTSAMIQPGAVVVDAGVATDKGKLVGDIAPDVRDRHDLIITPEKGGVGPLTVTALFDNVIRAATAKTKS